MNRDNIRFITRTGILLALTLVFQILGRYITLGINSNFIVGPLVNACLLIATATVGIWGGITISVIAPLVAAITSPPPMGGILLPFSPFIALGNAILVVCFYWLMKKNSILAITLGAIMKFAFLYAAIAVFLSNIKVKPPIYKMLFFTFGWPQFLTAVIGGILALGVIKVLKKNIEI